MIGFTAEDLSKVFCILNCDHDFVSTRSVLLCILDFEDDFVLLSISILYFVFCILCILDFEDNFEFRKPVVLSISVLVLHIEQLQRITPGVFKA